MSVQIIDGGDVAALYCDTSCVAFGPTFSSAEHAEDFCRWLRDEHADAEADRARGIYRCGWFHSADPRRYTATDLAQHHALWQSERVEETTGELLPETVTAG